MGASARVSVRPLERYLSLRWPDTIESDRPVLLGVSTDSWFRWKREGGLPWPSADQVAVELGCHPVTVWGDEWMELEENAAGAIDPWVEKWMADPSPPRRRTIAR